MKRLKSCSVRIFMKKELYEELFSIKSKIDRSEAKYRLLDRAKATRSKQIADEFIDEFQKAERERKEQREGRSMVIVDNITNSFGQRRQIVSADGLRKLDCNRKWNLFFGDI